VAGDAVREVVGDDDKVSELDERRRLRAATVCDGRVDPEAEMGVTRRFCMLAGNLDVLTWLAQGVGVPFSLSRGLFTAAQWTVGEMRVLGDTEGESGMGRRGGTVSVTMAALSSSLWKGLPR
jgi:hypothetical protein